MISEIYEHEVLRLIEIEKEFICQLELGIQLYSRPLKHYLISSTEHGKLFQNIEKILAISRYQLNRLQSLSERTIVCQIGRIFHEKVQLICEAFTRYISGYSMACLQLKQLIKCASFQRFIQGNKSNFSIEQFLQIPLNHIENLANQLDILCCTCENANDANYLLHVLKGKTQKTIFNKTEILFLRITSMFIKL
jgi:transcriptional regulator of met regulon